MGVTNGGGSWIRTNVEIDSADLQSAAIDHSAIPPIINLSISGHPGSCQRGVLIARGMGCG